MNSKRFKKLKDQTKDSKAETIEKLLPELKKNCTTKFDESVDLSFQINNKQKKSEINIRTVINLPGGTGKKINVVAISGHTHQRDPTLRLGDRVADFDDGGLAGVVDEDIDALRFGNLFDFDLGVL